MKTEIPAGKKGDVWDGFYVIRCQCPICGKFTSNNEFSINGLKTIVKAKGICKTHGEVDIEKTSDYGWI